MHMAVQFGFEKMAQRALDIWHSVLLCRCIQIEKATIDFRWKQLKQSWKAWRHCAECAQVCTTSFLSSLASTDCDTDVLSSHILILCEHNVNNRK